MQSRQRPGWREILWKTWGIYADEQIAKRLNHEFGAINTWQPTRAAVLVEQIMASLNASSPE